jgi:cysteinyl-tRNA synthetase
MNITDVGHMTADDEDRGTDKMEEAARRERLDPWKVARKYEDEFHEARRFLHFEDALLYPRATEHIEEMKRMVAKLLADGYAYDRGGNVYFDIAKFPSYGRLSGKQLDELEEGARVAVNPDKKDPRDFALWKVDDKHLMQWDAPWGRGFPGWHIECSAMSMKYLGEEIDVHTGGEDNIFPHHECEIAQSEAYTGKRFVRHWLHARHLLVNGEKMSKSKGNFRTIADLRAMGFDGHEVRFALIRVQYSQPLNFTDEGLEEARAAIARVRNCRARLMRIRDGQDQGGADDVSAAVARAEQRFTAAMEDDLNVSEALAAVFDLVSELNRSSPPVAGATAALAAFAGFEAVLACFGPEPAAAGAPQELQELAAARDVARKGRDFARADALRAEIEAAGFRIVDSPEGPRLERR